MEISDEPTPSSVPYGILALVDGYAKRSFTPLEVCLQARKLACANVLDDASSSAAGKGDEATSAPEVYWTSLCTEKQIEEQISNLLAKASAIQADSDGDTPVAQGSEANKASPVPEQHVLKQLPLFGVPFGVKDNIDVAGLPTTAACRPFTYTAEKHAVCVARLLEAGAIVIGKTNMDQFATGLTGMRSTLGSVTCALNAEYVSGGSSSGSAVVVANGTVPFALGTDTAGSNRVPAAFNNVVGLKPTPGRVSTHGVVPACRSLDCVGVFSLSVADALRVLTVLESEPDIDEEPRFRPFAPGPASFPSGTGSEPSSSRRLRFGVPEELVECTSELYEGAFRAASTAVGDAFEAQVVPISFDVLHEVAELLYRGPWVAERYATAGPYVQDHANAMDPSVLSILQTCDKLTALDAFTGQYTLAQLAKQAALLWDKVDVLMVPTSPLHPTVQEVTDAPVSKNSDLGAYTNFVNLLGWSALALPAAMVQSGSETSMPFGITWIAPGGHDVALGRLGCLWQSCNKDPIGVPRLQIRETIDLSCPKDGDMPRTEDTLEIAVVGAHLSGMPLHFQLQQRRAGLVRATTTAKAYKLYALPGTVPPKPGLVHVGEECQDAAAIEIEVYAMPTHLVGSFLALIPPPLGLGSVRETSGGLVKGFICEPSAIDGAEDITSFGGWRAFMADRTVETP